MKRTVIFTIFLFAGMLMFLGIFALAIPLFFSYSGWVTGVSRAWYYVYSNEGLGLGFFCILGIIMFLFGLIGLLRELPKKDDGSAKNAHEAKQNTIIEKGG